MPAEALRETIRVADGRVPLLDRHIARLAAGGCDSVLCDAARTAALEAAGAWIAPYGRMTLVVSAEGAVAAEVTARPSAIDIPGGTTLAPVVLDPPALPQGAAKPADRGAWDAAWERARERGADLALLVAPDGFVIDTSHATLWARFGDRLVTPPSPPALAGVSRGAVFDLGPLLGYEVAEEPLTLDRLAEADELFLTTAVAGARPVRGRGGEAAAAVAVAFDRLFAAR